MPTLKVNNVDHGTETWSPEVRQQLKTLVATETACVNTRCGHHRDLPQC